MTQGKHTLGLLVAVRNPAWGKVADIRVNGKAFAFVQSLVEADTFRLAAAWNACEGIPTEALEDGVVKDILEALRVLLELHIARHNLPPHAKARAAIARATREKP